MAIIANAFGHLWNISFQRKNKYHIRIYLFLLHESDWFNHTKNMNKQESRSTFSMTAKEFIFYEVLSLFISLFSLGLCTPLLLYFKYKRQAEATKIDQKQVCFKGTLSGIYFRYMIWYIVTAIILSLYQWLLTIVLTQLENVPRIIIHFLTSIVVTFFSTFFIRAAFRKWKYRSTFFLHEEQKESSYHGNIFYLMLYQIAIQILNIISVGLFYPATKMLRLHYEYRGIYLSSHRLQIDIQKLLTRKEWLLRLLFIFITFGLYWFYFEFRMIQEVITHTHTIPE